MIAYVIIFLISWPLVFKQYNVAGVALILFSFGYIFRQLNKRPATLALLLMIVLLLAPFIDDYWSKDGKTIRSYRNYYGIYRITVNGAVLQLINGNTLHGVQYLKADSVARQEPLSYYHRGTPVGKLLRGNYLATKRIGIVGLGAGTISAYGKTGEEMDFFELDPDLAVFVNIFDYLKNSRAKVNYYYDDARLGINKTPRGHYDMLIVDAFSGDSIPVHLLTTDAIQEYRSHLKDKGVILFHISNRYLDLAPVMFKNAEAVGAFALLGWNEAQSPARLASRWVVITWDKNIKETLVLKLEWKESPKDYKTLVSRPWTDKYSNVISILNPALFVDSIRHFMPFLW
jgi:spermidine synthase